MNKNILRLMSTLLLVLMFVIFIYPHLLFLFTELTYFGMLKTYICNWVGSIVLTSISLVIETKYAHEIE